MLDDNHQTVCDDGIIYLRLHGVFRSAPKLLDFDDKVVEMVPIEERGQLGENVFVIIHLPRVSAIVKLKSVDSKNLWNQLILLLFQRTISIF